LLVKVKNVVVAGLAQESDTAPIVARRAAQVAQAWGSELMFVTSYGKFDSQTVGAGTDVYVLSNAAATQTWLDDFVAALRPDYPGVTMRGIATHGQPGDALLAVAKTAQARLIVVGNHGVQRAVKILGSVARDVASKTKVDLLVVNSKPPKGSAPRKKATKATAESPDTA
jgi:nucleotide-binding universal stress UspA family protein